MLGTVGGNPFKVFFHTMTTGKAMLHSSSWGEHIYDDVNNFTDGPIDGESSTAHLLSFDQKTIFPE